MKSTQKEQCDCANALASELFPFKTIEVLSDGNVREKPNNNILEVWREAAIYCLILKKKIRLQRKFDTVEITPYQILSAVIPRRSARAVKYYSELK